MKANSICKSSSHGRRGAGWICVRRGTFSGTQGMFLPQRSYRGRRQNSGRFAGLKATSSCQRRIFGLAAGDMLVRFVGTKARLPCASIRHRPENAPYVSTVSRRASSGFAADRCARNSRWLSSLVNIDVVVHKLSVAVDGSRAVRRA